MSASRKAVAVWKFQVLGDGNPVQMPSGAEIVHVGEQDGGVYVWALINPAAPPEPVRLRIFATGQPVPDTCHYVGTAHVDPYVLHVFEEEA